MWRILSLGEITEEGDEYIEILYQEVFSCEYSNLLLRIDWQKRDRLGIRLHSDNDITRRKIAWGDY